MSKMIKIISAAAIGFVAGILVAPKSGEQTRKELKQKAAEAKGIALQKQQEIVVAAGDADNHIRQGARAIQREVHGFAKSAKLSSKVVQAEASKLGEEAGGRAVKAAHAARKTAGQVKKDVKKTI